MARTKRPHAFPRAFSIMVGILTGHVVDVLRIIASTKTYRASTADVTRELISKGMAVTAAEHALSYAAGRPIELVTGLIGEVHTAMGEEFATGLPGSDPDVVLQAVLSRMWPEVVQAMERVDTRTKAGAAKHRRLLAGPPLTRWGRPMTTKEIRAQALADIVEQRAEEPRLVPPRDVQEAQQQARLQTAADRLAMQRGVSAETLLAGTAGGRAAGMKAPDESAAAQGWSEGPQATGGYLRHAGPDEAEPPSVGEMLKQARKGLT